jgi:subtilisin family serine protease
MDQKTTWNWIISGVLSLVSILQINAQSAYHPKIDADLWRQLNTGKKTEAIVMMSEQADLSFADFLPTKEEKGEYVFQRLSEVAARTQAPILHLLAQRQKSATPLYIVNALYVAEMDQATALFLAQQPSVALLMPNPQVYNDLPRGEVKTVVLRRAGVEWGVDKIQAPKVWALGFTGQGVIIGGQDTGYSWDHPAIAKKYRGTTTNKPVAHNYNWYDAVSKSSPLNKDTVNPCGFRSQVPCDDNSHGTHTMGTMVGDDGQGNQIGVAPSAKWIGCRNMDRGWGSPFTYLGCFQWFLAPTDITGKGPNPKLAPHVINNSWGCPPEEGCNASNFNLIETAVNNLKKAGVVVVVSAGNAGRQCNTINDVPAEIPASFSVGATQITDSIASFSSRGGGVWNGKIIQKPEVSAPGVNVRSSVPGGGYASYSGTSMAGPHTAGAVALMISANPRLAGQVDLIESILERTATPLKSAQKCSVFRGDSIPNAVYGYGRINVYAAVQEAVKTTGLPNVEDSKLLTRAYPNPTQEQFTLEVAEITVAGYLELFDLTGKLLKRQAVAAGRNQLIEVKMTDIPRGLYLYRLQSGEKTGVGKIIKE